MSDDVSSLLINCVEDKENINFLHSTVLDNDSDDVMEEEVE